MLKNNHFSFQLKRYILKFLETKMNPCKSSVIFVPKVKLG